MEETTVTIDAESGELVATETPKPRKRQYGEFPPDFDINPQGIRALFAGENGVIRQAVDDAKTLIAAGVIKQGHIAVPAMPRKLCDGMTLPETKDLLTFFEDKYIGLLLSIAGIDLPPRRFRQRLDFDW